jgi:hypothetical protein
MRSLSAPLLRDTGDSPWGFPDRIAYSNAMRRTQPGEVPGMESRLPARHHPVNCAWFDCRASNLHEIAPLSKWFTRRQPAATGARPQPDC